MNAPTPERPAPAPATSATAASGTANDPSRPKNGFDDDDQDDGPWRHAPVAPKDEGLARSFGKAVSDVVTGPLDGADGKPKAP
jgi:hypothetical protein